MILKLAKESIQNILILTIAISSINLYSANLTGCCEDEEAAVGSCAKTEWCSSTISRCVNECQGSWDGLKCSFPSRCTTSREACAICEGRWHSRKIFASYSM